MYFKFKLINLEIFNNRFSSVVASYSFPLEWQEKLFFHLNLFEDDRY